MSDAEIKKQNISLLSKTRQRYNCMVDMLFREGLQCLTWRYKNPKFFKDQAIFYLLNFSFNSHIIKDKRRDFMKKITKPLAVILSLLILMCSFAVSVSAADSVEVKGNFDYDNASEMLRLVNNLRAENGAGKLEMDMTLVNQAMIRAAECAVSFSHTRPNGKSWSTYTSWEGTGAENISMGYSSAQSSVNGFWNSEGHKRNMLDPNFTKVGIGCFISSKGTYYWAQEFSAGAVREKFSENGTRPVRVNVALQGDNTTVEFLDSFDEPSKTDPSKPENTKPQAKPTEPEGTKPSQTKPTEQKNTNPAQSTPTVPKATEPTQKIPEIASVKLSKEKYVYNGKNCTPSVTVKDKDGKSISPEYYVVFYPKYRSKVGGYSVKVLSMADSKFYTAGFTINPKATKIKSVSASKKKLSVKWSKVKKEISGYKIMYSTKKNFKSCTKTLTVGKTKTSKTIKGLKKGKKYYVKVRTYKKINGKSYYSSWSASKSKKVK